MVFGFGLVASGAVGGSSSSQVASPELVFPASPGAAGSSLPERACFDPSPSVTCAQANQFRRMDYEGWAVLNGINEREAWAADPSGSGKTVLKMDVYGNDNSDQWGGTRAAIGSDLQSDQSEGKSGWMSLGIYIPVGFQNPDQWMIFYQNFSTSGNPAQALSLDFPPGGGTARNYWKWWNQTQPLSARTTWDLGAATPGHWHYFLIHIDPFTVTSTATVTGYYKIDQMPVPGVDAPKFTQTGVNTLYTGGEAGSKVWLLMYRGAAAATQHQTAYYCGYHRAADSATASVLGNCPLAATPPPTTTTTSTTSTTTTTTVPPYNPACATTCDEQIAALQQALNQANADKTDARTWYQSAPAWIK